MEELSQTNQEGVLDFPDQNRSFADSVSTVITVHGSDSDTDSSQSNNRDRQLEPKDKSEEKSEDYFKWWENDNIYNSLAAGRKCKWWETLEHTGPVFPPSYEPLPLDVRLLYDGKKVELSKEAEEVAYSYACLLSKVQHTKLKIIIDKKFKENFFTDWRKVMKPHEAQQINDLSKCNFKKMQEYFENPLSNEEKKKLKIINRALREKYGYCTINGNKHKIERFKIAPPKIFTGIKGNHPKRGMWKNRVKPEDVIINCSKNSKTPDPPSGHNWKEVKNDNSISWLSSWKVELSSLSYYTSFHSSSAISGMKDFQKYETARKLDKCIDKIENDYRADYRSSDYKRYGYKIPFDKIKHQRGVALYLIHRLALRAGYKKDSTKVVDTIGGCSLRVEHIKLYENEVEPKYVVEFNFPGKHSIPFKRKMPVEEDVFERLQEFKENKTGDKKLFDKLDAKKLNDHLKEKYKIPNLSIKVFRTYTASSEMEKQLLQKRSTILNKLDNFSKARKEIADLCNHSIRSTSLIYYIDPRIIVTWCNRNKVPIEEIYPLSLIEKFNWAIQKYRGVSDFLFSESNRQYL